MTTVENDPTAREHDSQGDETTPSAMKKAMAVVRRVME